MAEFLSSIVGPFTKYVMDPIVAKFRVLRHVGENIEALETTIDKLDGRRKSEEEKLEEAKKQEGVEASAEANRWFTQVAKAASDATNLKAEYEEHQRRRRAPCHQQCPNCFCCCFSRYQLSKRALNLKQAVQDLYAEDLKCGWTAAPALQKSGRELDTVCIEGQSTRETLKRHTIDAVMDNRYFVVGLHGMGGVGKTTLIRHVYNHFRNPGHGFNSVIFTTVSATPNFVEIRKEIARSLGLTVEKNEDDEDVKEKLCRLSSSTIGKYLLILDDMWEPPIDIHEICIPAPNKENGCKILMASRSSAVVTKFVIRFASRHCLKSIPVYSLPPKEAWNLFVDKVGEEITSKPEIKPLAEEVVGKCDGLPLAIIVVGGTMATRETEGEWKDAVRELEQSASNLEGIEEEVFSKLIFSFEKLLPIEQSLFLYCCLYPEDSWIDRELKIFKFAIGEETLLWSDMQYKLGDLRNRIDVLIGKLRNSSMLEGAGYRYVKMHDVMRELAMWITSPTTTLSNKCHSTTKFIAKADGRISEAPPAPEWSQANKISLMKNEQIESLPELPHLCPQLHTLFLQECWGIKMIPQVHFLDHMPALQILDLTATGIKNLPPSICNLVNLRVLCLRNCDFLEKLPPEIGMLLQLIWLDLEYCKCLRKLPVEMKKLKNLRHLDFMETWKLKRIPRGLLSGLHKLEELRAGKLDINGIRELSQLTRLTKSNIKVVEIKEKDDIMELSQLICLTKIKIEKIEIKKEKVSHWLKPLLGVDYGIQQLSLRNCDIDPLALSDLLEDFSRGKVWKEVEFKSCKGLTCVPTHGCEWLTVRDCPALKALLILVDDHEEEVEIRTNINNNAFESLYELVFDRLHQLETMCIGIPQPGSTCFTNLREIEIQDCPNLKVLFTKGVTRLLTNLSYLCVYRCSQLVKLAAVSDDDDDDAFPRLSTIHLCELPELTAICDLDLKWPSLDGDGVHIYDCPKLRRPPFGAHHADISLNDEIDSWTTENYFDVKKREEEQEEKEKEEEKDDDDDDEEHGLMSPLSASSVGLGSAAEAEGKAIKLGVEAAQE